MASVVLLLRFSRILLLILISNILSSCAHIDIDFNDLDCRNYIIYPFYSFDMNTSDRITRSWYKKASESNRQCDEFIPYEETKNFYSYLHIDSGVDADESLLDANNRERLIDDLDATHVIILKTFEGRGGTYLKPIVKSLKPLKNSSRKGLPTNIKLSKKTENVLSEGSGLESFYSVFRLMPNSISIGFSGFTLRVDDRKNSGKDVLQISQESISNLPRIVSSIWVGSIYHRYAYALFDVGFSIYGSLYTKLANTRIKYIEVDEENNGDGAVGSIGEVEYTDDQVKTLMTEYFSMGPMLGAELAFYLPIGTFAFGLNGGPAYTYKDSSVSDAESIVDTVVLFSFSYRAFMTDNLFFNFSYSDASHSGPIWSTRHLNVVAGNQYLMGIGYYHSDSTQLSRFFSGQMF